MGNAGPSVVFQARHRFQPCFPIAPLVDIDAPPVPGSLRPGLLSERIQEPLDVAHEVSRRLSNRLMVEPGTKLPNELVDALMRVPNPQEVSFRAEHDAVTDEFHKGPQGNVVL